MDGPTTTQPNPMTERAARVWSSLASRTQGAPDAVGRGVTEALLVEEVERELATLKADEIESADQRVAEERERRQQEVAALAQERDSIASDADSLRQLLASREAALDAKALEVAALIAALNEARAEVRPVAGTWDDWKRHLKALPALSSDEILAAMSSAIRRLASIGTTQADVLIARLAELLLRPYSPPTTNSDPVATSEPPTNAATS